MTGPAEWEQRVAGIRAWSKGGVRAPHKPLLLLYALGRLQTSGENSFIPFTEAEKPLDALLVDFGPTHKTSPGYPFHHLTSDGLWTVRTDQGIGSPGPNLGALRASHAEGRLDPEFAASLLAEPGMLVRVARFLLDANFPPSLGEAISDQVGLDLSEQSPVPGHLVGNKLRRDPAFRKEVLLAYEHRCAMCSWDARLDAVTVGLEAAHVRWFNIGGPDVAANGLALCVLHHRLLDQGVLGITDEHTIAVSAHFVGGGPLADQFVFSLLGKEIADPLAGFPAIDPLHIGWHTEQVFKAPGRLVAA